MASNNNYNNVIPMAAAVPIHDTAGAGTNNNNSSSSSSSRPPSFQCHVTLPPINDSPTLHHLQLAQLCQQGFPKGLAAEMGNARAAYPLRFWVIDNSGKFFCFAIHVLSPLRMHFLFS